MIVYLSMPITGFDLEERRDFARRSAQEAQGSRPYWTVITPFDIARTVEARFEKPDYKAYMRADIAFIFDAADALLFTEDPRTTASAGMRLEYETARCLGIPCYTAAGNEPIND